MNNAFDDMILNVTDTTTKPEDYAGKNGLLYCGKCHKPKEAYFPESKTLSGVTATRQNVSARGRAGRNGKKPYAAGSIYRP